MAESPISIHDILGCMLRSRCESKSSTDCRSVTGTGEGDCDRQLVKADVVAVITTLAVVVEYTALTYLSAAARPYSPPMVFVAAASA